MASNWIQTILVLMIGLYVIQQIAVSLGSFGPAIVAAAATAIVLFIRKGVPRR